MAKVRIYSDEFYFVGGPSYAPEVEVPDKVATRWKRVATEFAKMQEEMEAYSKAHYEKEAKK